MPGGFESDSKLLWVCSETLTTICFYGKNVLILNSYLNYCEVEDLLILKNTVNNAFFIGYPLVWLALCVTAITPITIVGNLTKILFSVLS